MLDVERSGLDAGAHHVTSLVLHCANAVLLFLVLQGMTRSTGRSAFVAALFALHPLHVESVAWIAARKDVLSSLFWILTMGAYARYVRRPGYAAYALVVLMLLLGLLSKPMVATLPLVLLLLDVWPLRRLPAGSPGAHHWRLVAEKIPLALLAAACIALTFAAQRQLGAVTGADVLPIGERLANAAVSVWAYLIKMVWPADLVPFYPYRTAIPISLVAFAFGGLVAMTAVAVWCRTGAPYVTVGWLWYLATLIPVLGLVQVGGHAMADRFTYVPLIGIFLVISWGGASIARRLRVDRGLQAAAAVAILVVLSWRAGIQASYWRNSTALWEHAVRVQPGNARAHANLGVALAADGDDHQAIAHYREALQLQPNDPRSHNNLALALAGTGLQREAIDHYREAVRLDPGYVKARINLANLLDQSGRRGDAIAEYRRVLERHPEEVLARVNLAVALGHSGRIAEALTEMLEAIRRDPGQAQWHYIAAMMWVQKDQPAEAIAQLTEALRLDPGHQDSRRALAELQR
jgi:Flp pilus assembly protein TadD